MDNGRCAMCLHGSGVEVRAAMSIAAAAVAAIEEGGILLYIKYPWMNDEHMSRDERYLFPVVCAMWACASEMTARWPWLLHCLFLSSSSSSFFFIENFCFRLWFHFRYTSFSAAVEWVEASVVWCAIVVIATRKSKNDFAHFVSAEWWARAQRLSEKFCSIS